MGRPTGWVGLSRVGSGRVEISQFSMGWVGSNMTKVLYFLMITQQKLFVVYCISASSAQSERDFSSAGHTIADVRCRLSAANVESMKLIRWGYACWHAQPVTSIDSQSTF